METHRTREIHLSSSLIRPDLGYFLTVCFFSCSFEIYVLNLAFLEGCRCFYFVQLRRRGSSSSWQDKKKGPVKGLCCLNLLGVLYRYMCLLCGGGGNLLHGELPWSEDFVFLFWIRDRWKWPKSSLSNSFWEGGRCCAWLGEDVIISLSFFMFSV